MALNKHENEKKSDDNMTHPEDTGAIELLAIEKKTSLKSTTTANYQRYVSRNVNASQSRSAA